jgi:hypothetical protein
MSIKVKVSIAIAIMVAIGILPFTGGIWNALSVPSKIICVKDHDETKYEYAYGMNPMNGKMEYHYGLHTTTVCDKSIVNPKWVEWNNNHGK